jgi:tetratricopeptide (TPR) repeat protein
MIDYYSMNSSLLTKYNNSQFHQKAAELREANRLPEALSLINKVIEGYIKNNNYSALAEAYKDQALIYKHLYLQSNKNSYLKNAKKSAEAIISSASKHNLTNSLPLGHFTLGEILVLLKEYKQAVDHYNIALNNFNGPLDEKGNYRNHLAQALYLAGQKNMAEAQFKQSLEELKAGREGVSTFLYNVWLSGAYLRQAKLLDSSDKNKSNKYLKKAKKIIESDKRLILRKIQVSRQ